MFIVSIFCIAALAVLSFLGTADAFWRLNCGIFQIGRIDPIISTNEVAGHAQKIVGGGSLSRSSAYDSVQHSQVDHSRFWTPQLYFHHSNGSVQEISNQGVNAYYLNHGESTANIKPFPPGFRMLSGDPLARSYKTFPMTHENVRPVADRISFACLDAAPMLETPNLSNMQCKNGLRAQLHFQSCWNGKDLYKEDNSHVAYMSAMDKGVCPPTHSVQLMHLIYEVLYNVDSVKQDGGQLVFAHGDSTGHGFHGDFVNGWDTNVQEAAIKQSITDNLSGVIRACPTFASSDVSDFSKTCPARPSIASEPVAGMLDKLPGCINITPGPADASISDMTCNSKSRSKRSPQASPVSPSPTNSTATISGRATTASPTTVGNFGSYVWGACYQEGTTGRALTDARLIDDFHMTVEMCINFCEPKGYGLAGVEGARQCFCGAQLMNGAKTIDTKYCDMACVGDSSELCGGNTRLDIYFSG